MRRFFTLILFLVSSELAGKVVYVSSSLGDDSNSGLSADAPIKTLPLALSKGDTVLMKSGDVFYGNVSLNHKVLSRYGKGKSPVICGYKRPVLEKWNHVSGNVWVMNLASYRFSGAFAEEGASKANNIGCLHEWDKDVIHGKRVQYREDLKQNWDFWQTERCDCGLVAADFDRLFLYFDGDPNLLKLEFSTGVAAVMMESSRIEGISVEGFGFGISAGTESVISGCCIDVIGGMLALGNPAFCSYGNGIEFYVARDIKNCEVCDCTISRCFDCGITIQASDRGRAFPKNIHIHNNLIYSCCQGWEDFLRNDPDVIYDNCIFECNTVLSSGESGFGYSDGRYKYCHILGNNFTGDKGMVIRNNVFIGGNYYCSSPCGGSYTSNKWEGNVCFIERGDFLLSNYDGTADVLRIPTEKGNFRTLRIATEWVISKYRQLTKDYSTRFIITSSGRIDALVASRKKTFGK